MAGKSLSEVLIAGLTMHITEDEKEAASRPPYPTPVNQLPLRDVVLHELHTRLPPQGDGPLVMCRILGYLQPYRVEVDLLSDERGCFSFSDAACALLAIGSLTENDVEELLPHLPSYSGFQRQLIRNYLAADNFDRALVEADRIPDDQSWTGYREIAAKLAKRADTQGFFALWKHYAAGKDRDWMEDLKASLVRNVARQQGWKAAITLTSHKRLGAKFVGDAFAGLPEMTDVDQLYRLFNDEAAGILSETMELSLLASAVRASTPTNPDQNHPLLDHIVDRIMAVDSNDKAITYWRDDELFYLWPAYGEKATLDRVRKSVRSRNYKRELTALPRDIQPRQG